TQPAFHHFQPFPSPHEHLPTYFFQIQNTTHLSSYLPQKSAVKHQTPQPLLFSPPKLNSHASHSTITKQPLQHNL
ncbi:monothiol bacilliredoxin BrxC family protein, partial [Bacillus sp. WP8]|uniref:monothiol bacilliredoxin BrxC family protein n=1 Tax=Bacillus sp. WP8 TaxID=756828 RepID=UPI00119DDF0D